jgi:anion-transporting  ArsA/GET3 family ATPase
MKVKLFLLVLMCLITGMAHAQEGGERSRKKQSQEQQLTTEERVKMQADRMKKDFELTDAQYDSVKVINLKYAKKAEELFKNSQADFTKNRTEMQKNQEEQNQELKSVLTEVQYKKYEEQLKAHTERGGKREQGQKQRPKRNN